MHKTFEPDKLYKERLKIPKERKLICTLKYQQYKYLKIEYQDNYKLTNRTTRQ